MLVNERISKNIIEQDEDFQKFALGRDVGDSEGEKRGLEQGKALGLEQAKQEMVLEIYKKDLPIDLIIEVSKLSESEVNAIIAETK